MANDDVAKETVKKEKDDAKPGERFEDLIASAEAIVKKLEAGQLTLEDSVAEWQKGMEYLKRGETLLASAERRVEILSRASGTGDAEGVRAVPFDEDSAGGDEGAPEGPRRSPPRSRG